jgi:hypothetical protein
MSYTNGLDKPTDYFNTITYTGNDTDGRTITGVGFQSDWTWVKARSSAFSHYIIDAIRYDSGASKYLKLDSSSSAADETPSGAGWISALNSDGYVCKNGTSNTNNCNENGVTYVAWNWLGANGTASNSNGSITSTVSANTTAGFSIVSYTGTGSNATVGHGLGTTPAWVLVKERGASGESWNNFHQSLGAGITIMLNLTNAQQSSSTMWNNTAPTSSVFSVGADAGSNGSSKTYIAYCFAEKKGYSKFGSYTGNGNSNGTFVYTGFKPAWVMCKISSNGDSWVVYDNKRDTFNVTEQILRPNTSGTEGTESGAKMDLLSNGFKLRGSGGGLGQTNTSGETYIYMAFAENPFVTSTGIPTTAR